MGGALIVISAGVSTLLWAELTNPYTMLALLTLVAMGAIGFMDDYLKVVQGRPDGLIARYKMLGQWTFGLGLGLFLVLRPISGAVPANHTRATALLTAAVANRVNLMIALSSPTPIYSLCPA